MRLQHFENSFYGEYVIMEDGFDWKSEYAHIKLSEKELSDLYEEILEGAENIVLGEDMMGGVDVTEETAQKLEKMASELGVNAQELYEAAFCAWSLGEE